MKSKIAAESDETERLVAELGALPEYRGWRFSYEYPGYFCYSHSGLPYNVFFTPDWWEGEASMPIEVQTDEGDHVEEHSTRLPLPREGRTGAKLLDLVSPTLDKLLSIRELTAVVCTRLSEAEIAALRKAHEYVRVHMAHHHSWEVRDAAMTVIGKVLDAASDAMAVIVRDAAR